MSEQREPIARGEKPSPILFVAPLWWNDFVQGETARLAGILTSSRLPEDWAEDIMQDMVLRFVQRRGGFQGDDLQEELRRWISHVLWPTIADHCRRFRRRRIVPLDNRVAEPMDRRGEETAAHEKRERVVDLFRRWLEGRRETDPLNYRLMHGRYLEQRSIADLAAVLLPVMLAV